MTSIRWLARNKFSQESELELARRLLQGLCVIPASGEFIYDTVEVFNGSGSSENKHRPGSTKTDFANSIDDIATYLPRCKTVNLVCAWFGSDLRMSQCLIRPGVENSTKTSTPYAWKVGDRVRSNAYVLAQDGTGNPYFGGTPTDVSIVRAIRYLKSKGISVLFYPFMMMDIQPGNSLPDPYSSNSYQPQQPWRGMITTDKHLSMGPGITTDKTSAVNTHVSNFFGTMSASDITCSVNPSTNEVTYSLSTTPDWRYRYHLLHYAKLCAAINAVEPGAVKAFMVGTEMREMLCVRDASNNFPGVAALNTLINDCKAVLGSSVEVSYASDWSECTGYKPSDNSGFWHHLDPIWANPNVSFVGIDNYFPISDWRDGTTHLDYSVAGGSIYNQAYLQGNIEGGELYDWEYYTNPVRPNTTYPSWYSPPQPTNDRNTQNRHAIVDPQGLGKTWVFRKKDLRNWWLNQHYNRPSNVESGTPTAWVPQSKRIVFTEYGAAKLDRSTNQPNVFPDSRSSQGGLPYYSNDEADKRLAINYYIAWNLYWLPANGRNPVSSVYGGNMIDMNMACVWCWDARPYDTFPVDNVWSDGANFEKGHWVEDIFMYALPDLNTRLVFLFLGQSNAEKHFYAEKDRTGTPVTEGATVFKARMAELYGVSPSRIVVIRGAVGGTSLLKKMQYKDENSSSSGTYHGYWWDEDTNTPSALALASKTLVANTPGILTGIVWDQGEADYINVDPGNGYRVVRKGMQGGGITIDEYKTAFTNFITWLRSSAGLNTNCPFLISGIGVNTFPSIIRMEANISGSGQQIPPDFSSYLLGIEKAQRDAINSLTNVYRGPKRAKPDGDYGPEWSTAPELAYDGIHLSGPGYQVQATRLADKMYSILTSPTPWTENSDTISGPGDEFIFVGSSVANKFFSEWYYTMSALSISSNTATITCKYPHKLTSSDVGAKCYIKTPSRSSITGFTRVEGTLASVASSTTLTITTVGAPNLASMNPGNDAMCVFYSGAQIAKNAMLPSKYSNNPAGVSITSFVSEASRFDQESDYLALNFGSYVNETGSDYYFGYGRWWNPYANSGAGGPDMLAIALGDYLAIRGSAVKGIVIWNGESEAFVESQSRSAANINSVLSAFGIPSALQYTGPDLSGYSATGKYLPRMRQLIAYLRERAGNPALKIYLVRAGGQMYSGTYYPFSGIIGAQNTLATDANVQFCAYPRNSPVPGEADIPIDMPQSNVAFTCKGYQDIGNRVANGIINNIVFPQYYVGYAGQSNAENMFNTLADESGVNQTAAVATLQSAVATGMSTTTNAINIYNGAKGGSALLKIMEAGNDSSSTGSYWWDDDTNTPGPLATTFVANLGNFIQVVVWDQGEADYLTASYRKYMTDSRYSRGEGMLGNAISMTRYKNALNSLFAWLRSAAGFNKPNLPILIVGPGYAETPTLNEIAANSQTIPSYAYAMIGLEQIHREVANTTNNVFLTTKKFRPKGDYGPEWPTQPKLSNDGIHYFGGANGYNKLANMVAPDVIGILNGTKTWASNSETTISGPANEVVMLGSFNGITTGTRFAHKVASWSLSGNLMSVTVAASAHNFGAATVGLQVVFTSSTGTVYTGTIDQNTSANTIRFPFTGANASGTGGYIQIKLGDQIIKDAICSTKSWAANQLSIVNFGIFASTLDERMDDLIKGKAGSDSNPRRSIGTWMNSDNTPSMLGQAAASYLATRGSAIKALVLNFGEFEYLYRYAAGGTILVSGTGTINVAQGAVITLSNGRQLQTSRSYTIYGSGIIYVATTDANQGSSYTYADDCVTAAGVSVTRTSGFTGTISSSVTTGNGIYRVTFTDFQTRYKQFIQYLRSVVPSGTKIFLNKPGNTWYANINIPMTESRTVIDNLAADTSIDPCDVGADLAMPLDYMKPADFGPSGTAFEWNPRATQQTAILLGDLLKTNI